MGEVSPGRTVSRFMAAAMLVFRPSALVRHSADHAMLEVEELDPARRQEQLAHFGEQYQRSVDLIRYALIRSFVIVACAITAAFLLGWALRSAGVTMPSWLYRWLQYGGVGVLLWGTLARVDARIETWGRDSLPERVDEFVYHALYVIGSFALALSVAW